MSKRFKGFHHETIIFLTEPSQKNSKEWFDANRDRYQKYIVEPSRAFVLEMGGRL